MTKEFEQYIHDTRNKFVTAVNELQWNTGFRTKCENLLIAYDQMKQALIFKTMSKLKELQLEVKDLHKHRVEETVLYARCGVTGKEMRLTFYGGIQVWQNGKLIREFVQEFQAVEFFNGL